MSDDRFIGGTYLEEDKHIHIEGGKGWYYLPFFRPPEGTGWDTVAISSKEEEEILSFLLPSEFYS